MTKFPPKTLAAALLSQQTEFDSSETAPAIDCAVFVTHVPDAPLQVMGRLGRDGQWRITAFPIPTAAEREDDNESAIAELMERKILVLRDEPVAEAMIWFGVPRVLTGAFTPNVEALKKRRLAASRFAVGSH
jgi:hypothetical protein